MDSLPPTITRFIRWWFPKDNRYANSRALFVRGVGVVYLAAIWSWWVQADALIGENGLEPAASYLEQAGAYFDSEGKSRFWNVPTVFWISSSDGAITMVCAIGVLLALLVIAGFAPGPCLLGLWVVYLSLVTTGGVFMSFQWDILLLETGVLAMLAAPWSVGRMRWKHPPRLSLGERLALWLCWFAVAKLMFQSGWVKLAWASPENPEWWPDHSALTFHYMTQPLPTWTAWWMHQLPEWFHKASIWPMYFVELILPFCILLSSRFRLVAAAGFAGLMLLILTTGNYTYFNWLTLVLCIPLVADRFWRIPWRSNRSGEAAVDHPNEGSPKYVARVGLAVRALPLLLVAILNVTVLLDDLHRVSTVPYLRDPVLPRTHLKTDLTPEWAERLSAFVAPFRLVSGYGLFRTMTIDRPEIIIEGSHDGTEWREYDVSWKPDRLDARPRFVAPHQPRVAWQLWFAALERQYRPRGRNAAWMAKLLRGLLESDPSALAFFNGNPFPDQSPKFVRAQLYLYDFTTRAEKNSSGHWWKREYAGEYLQAISLESFE